MQHAPAITRALAEVGPRLKRLRTQRGVTLAGLSEATGISKSTLSRLESGARRPTLELLLPLARAHGVTLDELVGAPPTGDPRIHLRPVNRHGMTMLPLTRRPGGIQAYKLVIPAGGSRREPEPKTHEGYEWLYVLGRPGAARPGRSRHHPRPRGGRRVRHPYAALVRGHQRRPRRVPQPHRQTGRTRTRPHTRTAAPRQ